MILYFLFIKMTYSVATVLGKIKVLRNEVLCGANKESIGIIKKGDCLLLSLQAFEDKLNQQTTYNVHTEITLQCFKC